MERDGVAAALDFFFGDRVTARSLFEAVRDAIDALGASRIRVTRSQVSFSRRRGFAWAWTPDRYLGAGRADLAPLVLSIALPRCDASTRWKEVAEPAAGRWMHHLELRSARDIDAEVRAWLAEAWRDAS